MTSGSVCGVVPTKEVGRSSPPSYTSQVPAQSVLAVSGGAILLWETDGRSLQEFAVSQQADPHARSKVRVHAHQTEIRLSCVAPLRASREAVLSEQGIHSPKEGS